MDIFELLGATISIGGTLASMIIALVALRFTQTFSAWRQEQRLAKTVDILTQYRDIRIFPIEVFAELTPEQFSSSHNELSTNIYRRKAIEYLNSMEFIALLINSKAIDEDICFKFMRPTTISSFSRLLSYILSAREHANNSDLYSEFEELARRWGGDR
ncbi:DUF4760 domain-containing protein [Asticcacaulis sp. MM231]|uniref:DUF4760 domain-containing protein n=1 Tax=Asticcacaulis sp. MM231 TaxID=3157666 RepID=UPI0032D57920